MDKNLEKLMKFLFPFFPKRAKTIISPENVPKCCLCGFWTKDPIELGIISMGKFSIELYCDHCYRVEKYSMQTPCKDGCKKCEAIR